MKALVFKFFVFSILLLSINCSKDKDDLIANGINKAPNQLTTGQSARDFLSAENYVKLEIELVYIKDYRPSSLSIANFKNFLEQRLNKPGGIEIIEREVQANGFSPYTIDEIRGLEDFHRTKFNNGTILTLFMYFVDGNSASDTDTGFVLGTAYRNTSFVIFENTIMQNSGGIGQPSRVNLETTVMNHEFCHLLGLVNIGSSMVTPHQDIAHGNHCSNENCLMNWQVENEGAINMLLGGTIPQLDTNCINDLIANGGKP